MNGINIMPMISWLLNMILETRKMRHISNKCLLYRYICEKVDWCRQDWRKLAPEYDWHFFAMNVSRIIFDINKKDYHANCYYWNSFKFHFPKALQCTVLYLTLSWVIYVKLIYFILYSFMWLPLWKNFRHIRFPNYQSNR